MLMMACSSQTSLAQKCRGCVNGSFQCVAPLNVGNIADYQMARHRYQQPHIRLLSVDSDRVAVGYANISSLDWSCLRRRRSHWVLGRWLKRSDVSQLISDGLQWASAK
jgi:hypothetical protein